ncbi:outer membrane protein assembly factor BamB family protein [Halomarina litorea]|uniref:outer membrane protein assembly factor BamB family protein n=1 Tax=Halomarina litorea TaxID=2961595 RepID=UPI0020C1C02E|nr:PQQ-binding-like beta-propeller repeat protein [Halomarina sp. BCD28]
MRIRTVVAVLCVVLALSGAALVAVLGGGGSLEERWVSDTARDNRVNHHAVGADGGLVVAPVGEPGGTEGIGEFSCVLVRLDPASGGTLWRYGVPPANCTLHSLTEPAIADVDGDGVREVLAASTEGVLFSLDADSGEEEFRVNLSSFGYARPTVADVTDDSTPEVVVSDIDGQVSVVRGDGSVVWRRALGAGVYHAPTVADVDADGVREVVVGAANRTVALDAGTGDLRWSVPLGSEHYEAAQADDDPALELVTTRLGTVRALDGADGRVEWTTNLSGTPVVRTVADGDGDGRAEAYVSYSENRVAALDARTGEVEWTTQLSADSRLNAPGPVLGDVDGDRDRELAVAAHDGAVSVLDPATGEQLATYDRDVPIWTHVTLTDLDGDGDSEVLVRYGDGRVVALDYRTGTL